ncbi:helix-turn-helix domain-containing protein [Halosimplex rubrum]|uniref:Helix-turn-helix domain-containing protein n=1 Tax=Halosimplex rubrum TaxID=869889 RepID=A0A7D5P449_9EURY|nr:helix-turn-helix domain-containing protein [Halosimplex rubrum]QLH77764.1 helix-turn-helix domain-containing protein [Halosimplex rubrum]
MSTEGLRVEMRVTDPGHCTPARAARTAGARVDAVSRTVDDGRLVQEFTLRGDAEEVRECAAPDDDLEVVFEWDEGVRYRERGVDESPCVCGVLSEYGYPLDDISATDDGLRLSFYTPDADRLEAVVEVLRSRFGGVAVVGLERDCDLADHDPVAVDRAELTDRQREVLETAFEMGYFETPKRANAGEVAEELDVALSTACEHLATAQRTVLSMVLDSK